MKTKFPVAVTLLCYCAQPEASPESEKAAAFRRLSAICKDRAKYPWLTCRSGQDGRYIMRAGTFGAGIIADIDNNPDAYGIDVYADCRVVSRLNEPLEVDITDDRKLSPEDFPIIPVFLKTAQKGQIGRVAKYERVATEDPFDFEKKRARALVNSNMAPAIFDVMDRKTKELLLHDDYYMMQYYDSIGMNSLFKLLRQDLTDIWSVQTKDLARALAVSDQETVQQLLTNIEHEGWVRARSFAAAFDAVLGLVRRLWSRDLRHCDLHGENILAIKETVPVTSDYFAAILRHGRGVALDSQMAGISWANIEAARSTLASRNTTAVTFAVLHPSRFRLIDLAYMIYMGRNKEKYKKRHPGASQPVPCRLLSCNRSEDTWELNRFLQHVTERHAETAWAAARSSSRLNSAASGRLGREAMKLLDKAVAEIGGFLKQLHDGVVADNPPWKECLDAQRLYKNRIRNVRTPAVKMWLRDNFHTQIDKQCTESQEMEALRNAQKFLESAGKKLQRRLPPDMRAGIIGTASWPRLPPLQGDVAGHLSSAWESKIRGSSDSSVATSNSNF